MWKPTGRGDGCRLALQERIGPALEDTPFDVHSQLCALRIQDNLNILTLQSFANAEGLAKQMDLAMNCNLANEGHVTRRDRQSVSGHRQSSSN